MSIFGIVIGVILLIVLALRGWNVIIASLLSSLVVIVFSGAPLYETFYQAYMTGFSNWAGRFFLMLAGGAVFAKVMEVSGAAQSISNSIMKITGEDNLLVLFFGLWFVATILVYGGISTWVIVYVMMPIMYPIFKKLNLPWTTALAVFVLAANAIPNNLPGAVTIYNVMPMQYLGTSSTAGWLVSLFASSFHLIAGFAYIFWDLKKKQKQGIGFAKPALLKVEPVDDSNLPNPIIAILPIIITLVTLNVFKIDVFFALSLGIISCIVLMYKQIPNIVRALSEGAANSGLPVIATCAVVGFGSVVASVDGFDIIVDAIINNTPGSPYVSWSLGVTSLAGITASASGGLGIAMEALLPKYMGMNLNPEALHRLASIATCGLDTLPHNGAIVTILTIFGLTHKEGYKYFFVLSLVISLASLIPGMLAVSLFY